MYNEEECCLLKTAFAEPITQLGQMCPADTIHVIARRVFIRKKWYWVYWVYSWIGKMLLTKSSFRRTDHSIRIRTNIVPNSINWSKQSTRTCEEKDVSGWRWRHLDYTFHWPPEKNVQTRLENPVTFTIFTWNYAIELRSILIAANIVSSKNFNVGLHKISLRLETLQVLAGWNLPASSRWQEYSKTMAQHWPIIF